MDASYKKDVERAKERQERNTHYLRLEVLRKQNGVGDLR